MKTSFAVVLAIAAAVMAAPASVQKRGIPYDYKHDDGYVIHDDSHHSDNSGDSNSGNTINNGNINSCGGGGMIMACCDGNNNCKSSSLFGDITGSSDSACGDQTVHCCQQNNDQSDSFLPLSIQNCSPLISL